MPVSASSFIMRRRNKSQRRKITEKMRWIIAKRQEYKCNLCLMILDRNYFDVDHIIERQDGGLDHIDNYQILCCNCHRIKTNHARERRYHSKLKQ